MKSNYWLKKEIVKKSIWANKYEEEAAYDLWDRTAARALSKHYRGILTRYGSLLALARKNEK